MSNQLPVEATILLLTLCNNNGAFTSSGQYVSTSTKLKLSLFETIDSINFEFPSYKVGCPTGILFLSIMYGYKELIS